MTKRNKPEHVEPTTTRETITPEMARKYLGTNYLNRAMRATWVEQLADTIRRGQWSLTHQGIAFDVNGRLLDGQHRLMAITQAGIAVECLVTRDLPEEVYRHIDAGKVRNLSDRVRLTDEPRANAVAVAIMRAYVIAAIGKTMAPQDLIENQFLAMTDEVMDVTKAFCSRQKYLTTGPIGAGLVCYWTKAPNRAREFMKSFLSGAGLEEGSPVLALREAAINQRLGSTSAPGEAYWKTIAATKYFHDRKPLTRIQSALEDWRGNVPTALINRMKAKANLAAETRAAGAAKS